MQKTVEFYIDEHNFVVMKISGDLLDEQIESLSFSFIDGGRIIRDLYHKENKKAKVLLDAGRFTGNYTAKALQMFADFAKRNQPFVEKTASFGGSIKVKIAGELATVISGRNNIKIFDTKEEALAWLGI